MLTKKRYILAVGLQIFILLVMIAMKWYTVSYGTKILLKTTPVDPWDPFRGDYIILNYEVSTINLKTVSADSESYKKNETIYVGLKKEGKYWVAKSVAKKQSKVNGMAVKGKVSYFDPVLRQLNISYGIDTYYVPEKQGKPIEQSRKLLDVEVAVDNMGNSAVLRIFMDDKEIKFQ
jgi:uncharacterized membrane-anchored protein